jgi:eukaryotic-like serine/threonine-protein kinase
MTRVLDDRYELGAPLGSGGMAEVVEGFDRNLGRRVAVKFLKTDLPDPRARERFEREARTAASFTHPNAVTVYDVGDDGQRPYIVMELVEGRTLADLLAEQGPLPPDEAARVTDEVLAALGAAHARGLVHRDVKPGNVLLTRDGSVKLADFGIAKAASDATAGLTATGQVMGTPKYLSPEQAAGLGATPRSDLYSTGVVLYEMLAGEPPFTGDTPVVLALAHQQAPVPPLSDRRAGVPHALLATVDRALEKDPAARYPDATAMRTALGGASAGAPGAATVPATATPTAVLPAAAPPPTRPRRDRRRARWVVAGLAGAGIVLLLVLLALAQRDGDDVTSTRDTTPGATSETEPTTTPTTQPPPPTAPTPQTIDELIALLAANPDAHGEKGEDLLEKLQELQEKPGEQGKKAAQLIGEVDKWVADGELDQDTGSLANQLLAPLARESQPPGQERKGEEEED